MGIRPSYLMQLIAVPAAILTPLIGWSIGWPIYDTISLTVYAWIALGLAAWWHEHIESNVR